MWACLSVSAWCSWRIWGTLLDQLDLESTPSSNYNDLLSNGLWQCTYFPFLSLINNLNWSASLFSLLRKVSVISRITNICRTTVHKKQAYVNCILSLISTVHGYLYSTFFQSTLYLLPLYIPIHWPACDWATLWPFSLKDLLNCC